MNNTANATETTRRVMGRLPNAPFEARPDCALLVMTYQQFCQLPAVVEDLLRAYRMREYTDRQYCWIEVADYRVEEIIALARREMAKK